MDRSELTFDQMVNDIDRCHWSLPLSNGPRLTLTVGYWDYKFFSNIYDYWSDIESSIHYSQNCNYTYQFWTLAFVAFYILILWGDGIRLSYINNENSETWPFKWMLFFGWCHPLYYLSSKTIKGCS